jgi:hypothetical protein
MELKEYKNKAHEYTAKSSEIARQINFAGIGIIWIIRTSNETLELSNSIILIPLILISISLLFDFCQYFLGGIIWIDFYRKKEKEGVPKDSDVLSENWRNKILYAFYYFKFFFMIVAYIFIIKALFSYF